jgi:acyl-coenzyme A thioesterase PaaI-like protein
MRFLRSFTAGALPFRPNHKTDTMTRNVLLNLLGGSEAHALRRGVNLWPPFLGAGIRVKRIASDVKAIDVEMKLRWWNANYVGTHFGGSLFAMTDAFYMLMLMANLGSDYIVWDKAASIRYRKPGRGTVRAEFRLSDAQLDNIRAQLLTLPKYEALFKVEVKDEQGTVIAEVEKILHVRRKHVSSSQDEPRSAIEYSPRPRSGEPKQSPRRGDTHVHSRVFPRP